MIRTTAEGGLLGGELSVTFNGETTTLDANAHHTGDLECVSALQALPNIEQVSCRRGPVSEFGGAEYLISIARCDMCVGMCIARVSRWDTYRCDTYVGTLVSRVTGRPLRPNGGETILKNGAERGKCSTACKSGDRSIWLSIAQQL